MYSEGGLLQMGVDDRIDADRWKPLMMKFQHFYGLSSGVGWRN